MEPVAVTVKLTTVIEGEDTVTASYDGLLRVVGDRVTLSYTEEADGARTSTLLSIGESDLMLTRRGAVFFFTVYRVGRPYSSRYSLGGLSFDALTETVSLEILRGAALPAVDCVYDLTLGGEKRRFSLSLRTLPREGTV